MKIEENLVMPHGEAPLPLPVRDEFKPIQDVTTRESLGEWFKDLKLQNQIVLVHGSLSSLGWVCGGARTVIQGLQDAVGEQGTLVFPAFTGDNTDPLRWRAPPVATQAIRRKIIESMPPFHPVLSAPWQRVGALPRQAVGWPGAVRSFHPQNSFVALGKHAHEVCQPERIQFDFPYAEDGVLGNLAKMNAQILFIGTSWITCTALHFVEHLMIPEIPVEMIHDEIAVIELNGQKKFAHYKMLKHFTGDFESIGADLQNFQNHLFKEKILPTGKKLLSFSMQNFIEACLPVMKSHRNLTNKN